MSCSAFWETGGPAPTDVNICDALLIDWSSKKVAVAKTCDCASAGAPDMLDIARDGDGRPAATDVLGAGS